MRNLLFRNKKKNLRQAIVFLMACHLQLSAIAQNLVLNPSFEDTISCYDWYNGTFGFSLPASNWNGAIQGSPDYFHPSYCGNNFMPANTGGFQWARTGVAYEGFGSYVNNFNNHHEFIGGQLSASLIQGHHYCMEFYVSPANRCKYFTDGIGVYFANDTIRDTLQGNYFPYYFPYIPVFESPVGIPITDTLNWVLVSGSFIAQGGERFFAIGNFRDDSNITLDSNINAALDGAYYFVDDVSLIDCTVGITETGPVKFSLTPNPVTDKLFVTLENNQQASNKISITNTTGQILWEQTYAMATRRIEIDVSGWPPGIYFITMQNNGGRLTGKFVKL